MQTKLEAIQKRLIDIGVLDPPVDGVFGAISEWALAAAHIRDTPIAEHIDHILKLLDEKQSLPLKPGANLAGRIVRAMQKHHYWINRHPSCFNIVYIEGMDSNGKANANKPNTFSSLRIILRVKADGTPEIVDWWHATTQPSKYWTMKPMNPRGAARIAFGQFKCWSVGMHNKNHEALVQTAVLPVYRDKKKLFKRYGEKHVGIFGINQHWGYDLPMHNLGNSSAGCLVGRTRNGHREFMKLVKNDARYKASHGSYRFMTTVMPAAEVP